MAKARPLRRGDHSMDDVRAIEALLESALVGRIAVVSDGEPYVVPMNFVYEDSTIFIHGASEGRLIEAIKASPRVCFEVDEYLATLPHPVLCEFDTAYASVICFGTARVLDDLTSRTEGLKRIARKYAPKEHADALRESTVDAFRGVENSHTTIIEITIESISGKKQAFNVQDFSSESSIEIEDSYLENLCNIPTEYLHHKRAVSPGKPIKREEIYLKWYEVRRPEVIIPLPFIRNSRTFLNEQLDRRNIEIGYGIGFVVLHYSDPMSYLLVCIWNGIQEMWQTLYIKETESAETFKMSHGNGQGPTQCVWEMTPIWHERDAWVRHLNSSRNVASKREYLADQFSGLA